MPLKRARVCVLTDGDDECCEGVAADDSAIVHDVLGCHFPVDIQVKSRS